MTTVDARGRSCPEPVILTKKAVELTQDPVQVMVDNHIAVENITRFAENSGLVIEVTPIGEDFQLLLKREK